MTQPSDVRAVDSDRIDGGGRGVWRRTGVALVLGAVVGALAGLLYGIAQPPSYSATTALSVLPDSTISQSQDTGDQQDATSFIQAQLVVLNSEQLADSVQSTLGLSERPSVSSAQVGQTYVVQITANAEHAADAKAVATATATAYTALRTGQLTASLTRRDTQIATQLKSVQAALAAATPDATAGSTNVTPAQTALQTQYQTLLQDQSALQLERTQINQVVSVLTPASSAAPGALSGTASSVLIGALLGAVVGLAVLGVTRRVAPRVRSVGDLSSLGIPVLLPVLPTRQRRAARGPNPWRSNAGRLLAARLAGRSSARRTPLIVVGATPGVGASHVAASLSAGMAERGPLLLVLASELVHGSDSRSLSGLAASDVSADGLATGSVDAIKNAVQSEIPGVWVLPCGDEVAAAAGPLPSKRIELLTDILRRATSAGWQVVVDAPALSESDIAVDCAAGPGVAVLVVARGVSRPADVVSASELFDAQGSRFVGAILNDRPGSWSRRRSGRRADDSQGLRVEFEPPQVDVDEAPRRRRRVVPVGPAATRAAARQPGATRARADDGRTRASQS